MKTSVTLVVLLIIFITFWFWPKAAKPLHLVVLSEQQGMLASRDEAIRYAIDRDWSEWAQHSTLRLSYIDSSQPQSELEKSLQTLDAEQAIDALLGCGDSVCLRKAIPWLTQQQRLILYPASSEGVWQSSLIVHPGLLANQVLLPAVYWLQTQSIRDVLMIGTNSARSTLLLRMLSNHESLREQEITVSHLLFDYPQQFNDLNTLIIENMPDLLILDTCEWFTQRPLLLALSALPLPVLSLCSDQPADAIPGIYSVQQLSQAINPADIRNSSAISRNMHWLNRQLMLAVSEQAQWDTSSLRDFFSYRSGKTEAGSLTTDRELRGSWLSVALLKYENDALIPVWKSAQDIRPQVFPSSGSPSTWLHDLTIYWRNAGGFWRTASTEEP
ncbi:MAG: transporter substrate-binding protein [Saccharospirillaceae bacterium]|nr:transporter substrate-binding protein [Saccharospirillaceae bacterium]MCD8532192.1 transporter substrate-binding protein [Saccharospirillaceae bacterium]